MQPSLYALSAQYQQAFLALADSDYDEQTINDTLEGMEGELVEKAQNVLAYALNLDAEIAGLKQAESRIAARRKSKELQSERMREYLSINMAASGITEIRAIDNSFIAKLHIGRDKSVAIDDASMIPADYMRQPETPPAQPDKKLIAQAIKDGFNVPGAHIDAKNRLEIK